MRLHELFDRSFTSKAEVIARHQAEIKHDTQLANINAGKVQDIMQLFKTDPQTASHLLDLEARKARKVIKDIETEVDKAIEDNERERVIQLVQAISDISSYEESQIEVDRLVAQYMNGK